MPEHTAIKPRTVQIGDVDLDQVFYRGEPVVTLAQIDEAHKRPDDTAGRNFRANKSTRFREGVDYFEPTSDEIRRMSDEGVFPPRTARGTLITRRGYLKVVKSLNDDLAWSVFDDMVEHYFAVERKSAVTAGAMVKDAITVFSAYTRLGRLVGLDKNQALIAANQATLKRTGENVLADVGVTHLLAPEQEAILTPTEIGERLGSLSGKRVNLLLVQAGLQAASQSGPSWEPTPAGERYAKWQDTGKKQGGVPIRQLKWLASVVTHLRTQVAA